MAVGFLITNMTGLDDLNSRLIVQLAKIILVHSKCKIILVLTNCLFDPCKLIPLNILSFIFGINSLLLSLISLSIALQLLLSLAPKKFNENMSLILECNTEKKQMNEQNDIKIMLWNLVIRYKWYRGNWFCTTIINLCIPESFNANISTSF